MKRKLRLFRNLIQRLLLRLLCCAGLHPWGRWTPQAGVVRVQVRQCRVCSISQIRSAR